jgi:hypothetical protein
MWDAVREDRSVLTGLRVECMPFWFWLEILIRVCCGVGDDWKQGKDLVRQDNHQENLLMVMVEERRRAKIYER